MPRLGVDDITRRTEITPPPQAVSQLWQWCLQSPHRLCQPHRTSTLTHSHTSSTAPLALSSGHTLSRTGRSLKRASLSEHCSGAQGLLSYISSSAAAEGSAAVFSTRVLQSAAAIALPWNHLHMDTNVSTGARTKSNDAIPCADFTVLIWFSGDVTESVIMENTCF